MRVAIVNPTGFYVGGAITLCIQYALIGIDSYIKDFVPSNIKKPILPDKAHTYSDYIELEQIANNYDRLIFVDLYHGMNADETVLDELIALKAKYDRLEICWIYCNRTLKIVDELLPIMTAKNFMFSHIYSLNSALQQYFSDDVLTIMRLNAFTPKRFEMIDYSERDKVVFSSGRVEAFKGTTRYISSIDSKFVKSTNFIFEHDGATFNFHTNDLGVSCPPQLLSIFDTTVSPKQLKEFYSLKSYSDMPDMYKFNIYPEYCLDDMYDIWKKHYAGVCCILGTKSGYKKITSLFDSKYEIADSAERNRLERNAIMWNDDIEYADLEKLSLNIPILFSRLYASIIHFTDERLIYDKYSDIPDKVTALSNCYEDVLMSQQSWYTKMIADVNKSVFDIFTSN